MNAERVLFAAAFCAAFPQRFDGYVIEVKRTVAISSIPLKKQWTATSIRLAVTQK